MSVQAPNNNGPTPALSGHPSPDTAPDLRVLLSVAEAADRHGYNRKAIRRWCVKGKIAGAERDESATDRPWLIPADELDAYVAGLKAGTGTDRSAVKADPAPASPIQTETEATPALGLSELVAQLKEANRQLTEASAVAKDSAVEAAAATAHLEARDKDLKHTTAERDRARSDSEHNRAEVDRLRTDLSDAKHAVALADTRTGEVEKARRRLDGDLDDARTELAEAREDLAVADAQSDEMERAGRRLDGDLDQVRTELAEAREDLAVADARADEMEKTGQRLTADLDQARAELTADRAELNEAILELNAERARIVDLTDALEDSGERERPPRWWHSK